MTRPESHPHDATDETAVPAVIYAAKSTEDKHGSIGTQLADCEAMAKREGWRVVADFKDEGFSAYKGNRGPGLERAKRAAAEAAAEHGECMLLAQHSDRFARGAGDRPGSADSLVEIWHAMKRQSIHLRSVQNDPMLTDALLVAAASKLAYEESKRKSMAVTAGKRRRAERGGSTGPLQFGYRYKDPDAKVTERVPDPDEAPAVRRMFEMLDEGRSVSAITRWLNGQGLRTKRGNTFGRGRIRDILTNPWYGGKMRSNGEVVDGNHEGLVPWEEFQRVSAKLAASVRPAAERGGRPAREPSLLSGVMRCAHCGSGIWRARDRYVCGNVRHATGVCDAARFDAALVEQAVVDHLDSLFVDLGAWIEHVTAERANQRDGLVRELAALNDQRQGLARDEDLVRTDYMRQLRSGNERAADIASAEVERIEADRQRLDGEAADLDARLAEWDDPDVADAVLDWWSEFSAAIRGEVVNAESVRDANAAMRERFAVIFVRSVKGGTPRLDFILRDRDPEAPLVSSRLWADTDEDKEQANAEGHMLVDFIGQDPGDEPPPGGDPVTGKPVGSPLCTSSRSVR